MNFNAEAAMKKFVAFIVFPAVAFVSLCSCSKNNTQADKFATVHFNAAQNSTKTVFGDKTGGGYPTFWSGNESVAVSYNAGAFSSASLSSLSSDKASAAFDYSFTPDESASSHYFYSVCPASAVNSLSGDKCVINLSSNQITNTDGSLAESNQVIVSKSDTYSALPSEVNLQYAHPFAYGKVSLKLPEGYDDYSVKLMAYSYELCLSGPFQYDFTNDALSPITSGDAANMSLTSLNILSSARADIFFAINPVGVLSDHTFYFFCYLTSPEGTTVYAVKDLSKSNLAFSAGQVSEFTLNFSSATFEQYTK